MPFRSIAQERWAHTPQGEKALGGSGAVAEWDSASKGLNLPKHVATANAVKKFRSGPKKPKVA